MKLTFSSICHLPFVELCIDIVPLASAPVLHLIPSFLTLHPQSVIVSVTLGLLEETIDIPRLDLDGSSVGGVNKGRYGLRRISPVKILFYPSM